MARTTYVKITFGFDKNKFGTPNIYRRGKGSNLAEAIADLFKQRGFNYLPQEQRDEIVVQLNHTVEELEKIVQNAPKKESKKITLQ